ncbi:MAG: hypothetical protein ACKVQA_02855 [Burkholderiales bacterium]
MLRKLTLNLNDDVYEALHKIVGQGRISQFVEDLIRPRLLQFKRVSPADGRGCVRSRGKVASESDIKAATRESARRRWARKPA